MRISTRRLCENWAELYLVNNEFDICGFVSVSCAAPQFQSKPALFDALAVSSNRTETHQKANRVWQAKPS